MERKERLSKDSGKRYWIKTLSIFLSIINLKIWSWLTFDLLISVWSQNQHFWWIMPRAHCHSHWQYKCYIQSLHTHLQEVWRGLYLFVIFLKKKNFLSKTLFSEPLHQIIQKINWWYQYKMFDIIKHFFALNKSWHYDNNNSHHPKSYEQLSHLYLNIAIPTTSNKHMRSCQT